jgi:hypothetical protein
MDNEIIKNFIVREFENFKDKGFKVEEDNDNLEESILRLNGEKWKKISVKIY